MLPIKAIYRFIRYGILSTDAPLIAKFVVTRRCNLSCGYCDEYDKVSEPVPLALLKERIAALDNLKTTVISCTGGEPLLHPDLIEIVKEIRQRGMIPTLITNGYLLTEQLIKALNDAGLCLLQISIDNVEPDAVSVKSLKVLDKKLKLLADHAKFHININTVMGIRDEQTPDSVAIAERAAHYGFWHSAALVHGKFGKLRPLSEIQYAAYRKMGKMSGSWVHKLNYNLFQKTLIKGQAHEWRCRAGARYLYISEDGCVYWCPQQRTYPGIPVTKYTIEDIGREYHTYKECSPLCTMQCVHQASMFDEWRGKQFLPDPLARQVHIALQDIGGQGSLDN